MATMTATVITMNTKRTLLAAAAAVQRWRQQQQRNGGAAAEVVAARQWHWQQQQCGSSGSSLAAAAAVWRRQRGRQQGSSAAGSEAAAQQAARWQRCVGSRIASAWVGSGSSTVTLAGVLLLWLRRFWQFWRPCITSENGRLSLKIKIPHERHTKNPVWYLNGYLFHVCIFYQLIISCPIERKI